METLGCESKILFSSISSEIIFWHGYNLNNVQLHRNNEAIGSPCSQPLVHQNGLTCQLVKCTIFKSTDLELKSWPLLSKKMLPWTKVSGAGECCVHYKISQRIYCPL